jgi:NAD(P)-dependent dehydrogenase (short-subunit alcohol dehydrogenase family)
MITVHMSRDKRQAPLIGPRSKERDHSLGSPMHRAGRMEEIEGPALFFSSKAASLVTGAQYTIDGGQLLGRGD